jgi:hypothetical protein
MVRAVAQAAQDRMTRPLSTFPRSPLGRPPPRVAAETGRQRLGKRTAGAAGHSFGTGYAQGFLRCSLFFAALQHEKSRTYRQASSQTTSSTSATR